VNLVEAAKAVAGAGSVRAGNTEDAVDGVVPKIVVEPPDGEAVAAILAWASREKLSLVPRGSGTKLDWGPTPHSIDLLLSTARLNRVIAHRHGDLTATVQAGATLAAVNAELARHRQWIPLDPPAADRATIGGVVATNDSGPRRHRYGAPRDLIIGIELARADGRLAKGGGIVVKNVAGYDLPRLLTGSFGSLAVIVSATFKLYPLTSASRTLVADCRSPEELGSLVSTFLASPLTPTALELAMPPLRLLVRFESIDAAVEKQTATATKLIEEGGGRVRAVAGSEEAEVWAAHARHAWDGPGAVIKVSVLPDQLSKTLGTLQRLSNGYAVAGRAGLGVLLVRVDGTIDAQARVVNDLRESLPQGRGSAVAVRASRELKGAIDVWGPIGDGLRLMREVKRQFDPAGILNPGRGPGGI
jgi:glycolate dehydrogenase FAD-binding subunit